MSSLTDTQQIHTNPVISIPLLQNPEYFQLSATRGPGSSEIGSVFWTIFQSPLCLIKTSVPGFILFMHCAASCIYLDFAQIFSSNFSKFASQNTKHFNVLEQSHVFQ